MLYFNMASTGVKNHNYYKILAAAKQQKKVQALHTARANATSEQEFITACAKLAKLRRNSVIRCRRRSVLDGRPRGIFFGQISRHQLREQAGNGLVPGMKKACW